MKTVLVYLKKGQSDIENAIYVEEEFSYMALIFGVFWLLIKGLWPHFFAFSLASLVILELAAIDVISQLTAMAALTFTSIYLGMNYSDYVRYKLERNGYVLVDIVIANSTDEAKYRFLSKAMLNN